MKTCTFIICALSLTGGRLVVVVQVLEYGHAAFTAMTLAIKYSNVHSHKSKDIHGSIVR